MTAPVHRKRIGRSEKSERQGSELRTDKEITHDLPILTMAMPPSVGHDSLLDPARWPVPERGFLFVFMFASWENEGALTIRRARNRAMRDISVERRSVERIRDDAVGPVSYRTESTDILSQASIADFTINGIGLVVHRAVPVGASLTIEAGPTGESLPAKLTAEVRHIATLPDGRVFLGCRFSRSLSAAEVLALG